MSYPGLKLTNSGRDILAKGIQGKEIKFSKAAFGSGNFDYSTEDVSLLSNLKHWEIDLPIVDNQFEGNGQVLITAFLNTFTLTKGFAAKEVGMFAVDPDSGQELLYAYGNFGDEYTWIPADTGFVHKRLFFGYRITIADAPNVTFNIDNSFAFATKEKFLEHINSDRPHPNSPTKLDDVDFSTHFWATDFDDHLHKISANNVKNLLLKNFKKDIARDRLKFFSLADFFVNFFELGLDANLFFIENFAPPTLIDSAKEKITSATFGGNLIGVNFIDNLSCGQEIFISDGANQQVATIEDINSGSPTYLKISPALNFTPNLDNLFLFRSQTSAAEIKNFHFSEEIFSGHQANIQRNIFLKSNADEIIFEKFACIDSAGFFSLGGV